MAARNKPTENQEVDQLDVVPKKSKSKAKTSRPEDVQKKSKMNVQDFDKLIKVEKGLLPFNGHLPHFLYEPIKSLKRENNFLWMRRR